MAGPEAGEVLLGQVSDPVTPDWHTSLYRRGDQLIIRTRRESTGSSGERAVPLSAAGWIHRTITQGFWREPADGGFDRKTTRAEAVIAGERLELRRSWGLGGPEGLGFTLTNHSRVSQAGYPEEYPMTDELLITGGLLALFAGIPIVTERTDL